MFIKRLHSEDKKLVKELEKGEKPTADQLSAISKLIKSVEADIKSKEEKA